MGAEPAVFPRTKRKSGCKGSVRTQLLKSVHTIAEPNPPLHLPCGQEISGSIFTHPDIEVEDHTTGVQR